MSPSEAPDEPRWLSVTMVLAIHAHQIERYGGAHGVSEENVLHSATARPRQRWAYEDDEVVASYLRDRMRPTR